MLRWMFPPTDISTWCIFLVFAALRVYAMFNRSRLLFCLVLLSGLMNPVLLLVSVIYHLSHCAHSTAASCST